MNIYELVRNAVMSLEDQMMAAGRVPGPGQTPQFIYEEDTNSFRLSILTIAREDCPHESGTVRVSVMNEGRVAEVLACPICQAIVS